MVARFRLILLALAFCGQVHAAGLDLISNKDAAGSLKDALATSAKQAVSKLGRENGYLGNPKIKIPLPPGLDQAEGLMRTFGMGSYADELVTTMNRAAEKAAPEAKDLLLGAVKKMTVDDAKGILTGGNDAATQYFRKNTEAALTARFLPIVTRTTEKLKLAQKYDQFAGKAAKVGLVSEKDARLEDYVTRKALDGLYLTMAEEEKAIRANPLQAGTSLAQKVFGLLKGN